MSSQKLSVYTIKVNNEITWDGIVGELLNRNSEQERCIITEQSSSYIGGCYLLEGIYNQTQYDVERNLFVSIPVKRFNVLKFDLFLSCKTMLLWGGKKVAAAFLTAIEIASNQQIIIEYKDSDFKKIVQYLLGKPEVSLSRMKITDIVIDHGIVANCSVNLKGQEESQELVRKYMDHIAQISVSIGKEDSAVSVSLFSSGAIVVYRDRDDIPDEAMNTISEMLGGVI